MVNKEVELLNWVLDFTENQEDYLVDAVVDSKALMTKQDWIVYQYNQWSSKDCTIYSAIWWCWDLNNHKFSIEEIKRINERSWELWRTKWSGWYIQKAIDLVKNYWNELNPNDQIIYVQTTVGSELFWKLYNLWYTLMWGITGDSKYIADRREDWDIDWVEFDKDFYHAINFWNKFWRTENRIITLKDSYLWRDYNIYDVQNWEWLVKNWNMFKNCYCYLNLNKINKTANQIKFESSLIKYARQNSLLWNAFNSTIGTGLYDDKTLEELKILLANTNIKLRNIVEF